MEDFTPYTKEEWAIILDKLEQGCTFKWRHTNSIRLTVTLLDDSICDFGKDYTRSWNLRFYGERYLPNIYEMCTPDGKDILNPDGIQRSKLEKKCRRLWNNSNWVKNNPHLAY